MKTQKRSQVESFLRAKLGEIQECNYPQGSQEDNDEGWVRIQEVKAQAQQLARLSMDALKDLTKTCKGLRDQVDREVYRAKQAGFQEWLSQSLRGGAKWAHWHTKHWGHAEAIPAQELDPTGDPIWEPTEALEIKKTRWETLWKDPGGQGHPTTQRWWQAFRDDALARVPDLPEFHRHHVLAACQSFPSSS